MAKQTQTQTVKAPAKTSQVPGTQAKAVVTKAKDGKATVTKTAETRTVYIISSPPSAGKYLCAYTAAVMGIVGALPKAKQAKAAELLHGKRAMRYHGKDGTRKIVPQESGEVQYDKGYFNCGPASFDEKRRAVPASWVTAFTALINAGEFPAQVSDGFAFPLPKVTDKQSPRYGKPIAARLDIGLK